MVFRIIFSPLERKREVKITSAVCQIIPVLCWQIHGGMAISTPDEVRFVPVTFLGPGSVTDDFNS
jgi:hypothetical protein